VLAATLGRPRVTVVRSGAAVACAVVCVLAASAVMAATRYDPRLRFRTISTPRFDIHFHQGQEASARRLASFVEDVAARIDATIGPPGGRVQVILVDQHDLSNGWATPLPYNTIELSAAPPAAGNSVGNTDDWLRLVFAHEYTHISHLSRAGGWIGGLRRGFGRLPLLFPNLYQPVWGIEGMATWQESAVTSQGRVRAGDFRLILDQAVAANRFDPLDRVNGGNVDWPGGAGPYVYGAYFHHYLSERYGTASLRALADETARRLPYLGSRAYKKVFGRSLGELWTDFETSARNQAGTLRESPGAARRTRHGFTVSGPRYGPGGRIYYAVLSPHHFPALMELGSNAGPPRYVSTRYLGNAIGIADRMLVVDEVEMVRSVGMQSDLYLIDPQTGHRSRLTREARAMDPDVSGDGVVVCVVQMSDRRAIATLPLKGVAGDGVPDVLVSEPSTYFATPRWSPDGRWIAAERRRVGEPATIVLIDTADRSVHALPALAGGRSASPTWSPDGARVLFSAAAGPEPFRIYSVELASGLLARLEGTGDSAQSPDVSPDGTHLVFVGATPHGTDLFSMPLEGARWSAVPAVSPSGSPPAGDAEPSPGQAPTDARGIRDYSPWATLVPRFWTPTLESDANELVVGAATGSLDSLARHVYAIEGGWATRARPDWQIAYAYDRWQPTLFATVSDDTDPWRSGELRTREADAGLLWRIARVRVTHSTFAAFHVAQDTFACEGCTPAVDADVRRASLRTGWHFTSARGFGYSIGPEEGASFTATAETTRRAFGADGNGVSLAADVRHYHRLRPRHAVVAVRAAAAGSWGDPEADRIFSASGAGPQPAGFGFGLDAIGLLRGFDEDEVTGTHAVLANIDYRVPLARIDRGVGTVPVFLRSVHASFFVDAGNAWSRDPRWSDLRLSVGGELSIDTVIGFALPVTFTTGAAWRRDGAGRSDGFAAFGRIGRAF
jgi:hypothetical protein